VLTSAFFAALMKFGPLMCCTSVLTELSLTKRLVEGSEQKPRRQSWRGEHQANHFRS
jgi:hypothetical protein